MSSALAWIEEAYMRAYKLWCAALLLSSVTCPANSELISLGEAPFSAQGFGNANRILTLQDNDGTEAGSVFPFNGGLSGTGDVVNPLSDNQKFGVPTLGELNWTTASDVQLLFNAIEPGGDSATINTVTLSFFSGNTPVFSISNAQPLVFPDTETGNGSAGFLIGVSDSQLASLKSNVFDLPNFQALRIGLFASLSEVTSGPESFNAIAAIPLPTAGILFLTGMLGIAMLARRKRAPRSRGQ
jgi:hypothetical protein